MSNGVKISVIVPIYNAENFLERAVDSLIKQNNSCLEVILVDDGSVDKSGKICDEYAEKYEYIKVVHKINGGLSTARNAGLKAATGTHISFLDADDFVDENTYEKIIGVIEKCNPDCMDFGWKYINDEREVTYNLHGLKKNVVLDKDIIRRKIIPPLINVIEEKDYFIYDFAYNKIYKKQIIDKYNICFDNNRRTWEDRIFVVEYLKYCSSFYSIDECFYNYVSVPNSLSRKYDMDFFNIILANFQKYQELFGNEYDFECEYSQKYWHDSISNMIIRSLKEKDHRSAIKKNILTVLKNEQVISWFSNSIGKNDIEKKINELIVSYRSEEALQIYESMVKKELWKNTINKVKYMIHKLFNK